MRRELKKRRTRTALVDAALDLFLERGYEATTIDEIVAAVEVSQRTFFRYFATKEDVVTGFLAGYDKLMADALAARPPDERPLIALYESLRAVLAAVHAGDPAAAVRFRKVHKVIEANPPLMAAQMARHSAAEGQLVKLIAERQGVDPDADIRPRLLVAFHVAAARVAFEDCARRGLQDAAEISARVERIVAMAREDLPGWL
ncbi:TetR family transcriptional regulator [Actinomadura vinacea]|uniref:TetR family transcriptional regulator n=1 Tax=Actinomadura vinacea TaxID=115336 RepID=A0ABN3JS23_9ACTN